MFDLCQPQKKNVSFDLLLEQCIDQSYNHIFLEAMHSNFTYRQSMHIVLLLSCR